MEKEGYIKGVVENSPAVISVNMAMASFVVLEFLTRIHPYRVDDFRNEHIEGFRFNFLQCVLYLINRLNQMIQKQSILAREI
ncbi:MAG: hypothetical protein LBM77_08250 [Spirochaetaceae bacterium]|nr:hypothetical protein [Spirochaetaceae bacterium]